jgi:serine/threonine protein kinase
VGGAGGARRLTAGRWLPVDGTGSFHHPPQERPIELEGRLQAAVAPTYRILRELGAGGMSRVFLAEEARLSRQVVVKVLREVRQRLGRLAQEPGT